MTLVFILQKINHEPFIRFIQQPKAPNIFAKLNHNNCSWSHCIAYDYKLQNHKCSIKDVCVTKNIILIFIDIHIIIVPCLKQITLTVLRFESAGIYC